MPLNNWLVRRFQSWIIKKLFCGLSILRISFYENVIYFYVLAHISIAKSRNIEKSDRYARVCTPNRDSLLQATIEIDPLSISLQ
jgi:hypothetical protein